MPSESPALARAMARWVSWLLPFGRTTPSGVLVIGVPPHAHRMPALVFSDPPQTNLAGICDETVVGGQRMRTLALYVNAHYSSKSSSPRSSFGLRSRTKLGLFFGSGQKSEAREVVSRRSRDKSDSAG